MILCACSTTPSRQVTVRDVTAVCPEPEPVIDRSFASDPPACVAKLALFSYATDAQWIELAESGTRELTRRGSCLREVSDWIESERLARSNVEGLAHD